jgi:hypothetical protein
LNRDISSADGEENQLAYWKAAGILKGFESADALPHIASWDDATANLHERALAYLDVNCAHCHNPNGLASGTRLDLRYEQNEPWLRGVLKAPTAAGWASANKMFAIVPGQPDHSFLLSRIESDEPNIRMPEQGRTVIHEEGVELIRAWIEAMPPVGDVTLGGD